jgi:hypothetical protein
MLAKASRIDVPLGAGGAEVVAGAEALPCCEPSTLGGGLPGGVVESSVTSHGLDYKLIRGNKAVPLRHMMPGVILLA